MPVAPKLMRKLYSESLQENMTLRDYFAAAALQGICSTLNVAGEVKYTLIAEDAYKIADAMIAERSKA